MMQAGKDYIAKGESEYESPRAIYLRELLQTIKAQGEPTEIVAAPDPEGQSPQVNQTKPTLKLRQ